MSEVNLDLLDSSIDELADLKGFEPIPAGTHKVSIKWDTKDINGMPSVILKLTVLEGIECSNSNEELPEPGRVADIAFMLTTKSGERNELGEGQLKEVVSSLQPYVGGDSPRAVMENSEGAEVIATLKVRANKNDPDQKFNQIKSIVWPE
jgi:hypothetical protein